MRIDEFYLRAAGGIDILPAVADTMTLFHIRAAGVWPEGKSIKLLPEGSVLVEGLVQVETSEIVVKINIKTSSCAGTRIITGEERSTKQPKGQAGEEDITGLAKRLTRLTVLRLMRQLTGVNSGPWGILRGVRPTKIVHRLLDQSQHRQEIIESLLKDYGVTATKAELVTDIALHQRPVIASPEKKGRARTVSIYIGVPYCPSKCLYCSFPAFVLPERREQLDAFLRAITKDMESAAKLIAKYNLTVENIYIGGGTPTSLKADDFDYLLKLTRKHFFGKHGEFTVEAGRPDSIDDAKINILCSYGVNRVSINPQTMQEKTLKLIGRRHTVQDIIDIFGKIRHAGIPVINMDVIAGLPGETEDDMESTMRQIAVLNPENITVHTLALKRGSILKESLISSIVTVQALPDEQTTANMLNIAAGYTANMNMRPYYLYRQKYMTGNLENIGYAKQDTDCLYNIQIMEERQTILGIGPAAGTKAINPDNFRLQSSYNAKDVDTYIKNLDIYLNERNTLLARLYGDREED